MYQNGVSFCALNVMGKGRLCAVALIEQSPFVSPLATPALVVNCPLREPSVWREKKLSTLIEGLQRVDIMNIMTLCRSRVNQIPQTAIRIQCE